MPVACIGDTWARYSPVLFDAVYPYSYNGSMKQRKNQNTNRPAELKMSGRQPLTTRKLSIGIQGFEKLRTEKFVYVDKAEYIYDLAHSNTPCFLSRPRRFGKSFLLSAMRAYRKEGNFSKVWQWKS